MIDAFPKTPPRPPAGPFVPGPVAGVLPAPAPGGPREVEAQPSATPVADRIRERLRRARVRFHANDNIAAHLHEGELEALQLEVAAQLEQVLRALVIDTDGDHNTRDTARRVAKMYLREVFGGRYAKEPPVTEFPNVRQLSELMIVGPVTVRSACSHHLCPIIGRVWVGVMPNEHSALIGLSKYARLVEWVMTRPQIQEEAISQLGELLQDKMQPDGLAIVMEADHYNAANGITGILCHSSPGDVFLQLIEGGRAAVNALYAEIVRDPRHRDVTLLDYAEITARRFASWRMGSVSLNRVNQGSILRFSEGAVLDPFTMSGPTALALLEELVSTAAITRGEGG